MSHKYRLYPTLGREVVLARHCESSRQILNVASERKATTTKSTVAVVVVSPAHTSQRCATYRPIARGSGENQVMFPCQPCGLKTDADVNVTTNILLPQGWRTQNVGKHRNSELTQRQGLTLREFVKNPRREWRGESRIFT